MIWIDDEDDCVKEEPGAYYCGTCNLTFNSEITFQQHVAKHQNESDNTPLSYNNENQCCNCHHIFPDPDMLEAHLNFGCEIVNASGSKDDSPMVLELTEDFVCTVCFEEFTSAECLKDHTQKFHEHSSIAQTAIFDSSQFIMPISTIPTTQIPVNLATYQDAAASYNFSCHHCQRRFINPKALKIHLIKTHNENSGPRRPPPEQVKGIVATHLGNACDECGRRFPSLKQAKVHKFKSHIQPRKKREEIIRRQIEQQERHLSQFQESQSPDTSLSPFRNQLMQMKQYQKQQSFYPLTVSKEPAQSQVESGPSTLSKPTIQSVFSLQTSTSSSPSTLSSVSSFPNSSTDTTGYPGGITVSAGLVNTPASVNSASSPPNQTLRRCRICSQWFKSPQTLLEHQQLKHSHLPHLWQNRSDSQSSGNSESGVSPSSRNEYNEEAHCQLCDRNFTSPRALKLHNMKNHPNLVTTSPSPNATVSGISPLTSGLGLRQRIRRPSNESPQQHPQLSFNSLRYTNPHSPGHPYACTLCSKRFVAKTALRRHMDVHEHGKAFQCKACLTTFTRNYSLKVHRRRNCPGVPVVYRRSSSNEIADDAPAETPTVGLFSKRSYIRRKPPAGKNTLGPKKKFQCPRCGVGCNHASNLYTHYKRYCRMRNQDAAATAAISGPTLIRLAEQMATTRGFSRPFRGRQTSKYLRQAHDRSSTIKIVRTPEGLKAFPGQHPQSSMQNSEGTQDNSSQSDSRSFQSDRTDGRHLPDIKENPFLYKCPTCGRSFFTKKGLVTHRVRVHGEKGIGLSTSSLFQALSGDRDSTNRSNTPVSVASTPKTTSTPTLPNSIPRSEQKMSSSTIPSPVDPANTPTVLKTPQPRPSFVSGQSRPRPGLQSGGPVRCSECKVLLPNQQFLNVHHVKFHGGQKQELPNNSEPSTKSAPSPISQQPSTIASVSPTKSLKDLKLGYRAAETFNALAKSSLPTSSSGSRVPQEVLNITANEDDYDVNKGTMEQRKHKPLMANIRLPDGRYQCPSCPRVYPSRLSLTGHLKSHYNKHLKPYPCELCLRRFTTSRNLRYHIQNSCKVLNSSAMKLHKQLASQPKPIPVNSEAVCRCLQCHKIFESSVHLEAHIKEHHSFKNGTVNCIKCGRNFASYMAFRIHMTRTHGAMGSGGPFPCHRCGEFFGTSYAKYIHIRLCNGLPCNRSTAQSTGIFKGEPLASNSMGLDESDIHNQTAAFPLPHVAM